MAKPPKFSRWQSPQAWTRMPVVGCFRQIGGHHRGGAAIEGEGRLQHAAIADRQQLGLPARVRGAQDVERIRPVRRSLPQPLRFPWHLVAKLVSSRPQIGRRSPIAGWLGVDGFRVRTRSSYPSWSLDFLPRVFGPVLRTPLRAATLNPSP